MLDTLLDPLFRMPFAVGLLVSVVLSLVGALLRLRDEWLAALGLAHLAGASAVAGLVVGLPAVLGAPVGAALGAVVKSLGRVRGNTVYAVMILTGWAAALLLAANSPLGSVAEHALIEGQLYFAGGAHLAVAAGLAAVAAAALPVLAPRLIRARLLPAHEQANALPAWRWHFGFDLLGACAIAVAAGTLGIMGAFALAFVPSWVAFRLAGSWRGCLGISLAFGVAGYGIAFPIALVLDQPFGPTLVAIDVLAGLAALLVRRR